MAKQMKNNETKKHETIVVKGQLKKAYIGKTKFSEDVKNRITLFNPDLDYNQITAYDDQPDKLTPGWYKEAEGYINLSSTFDIPVQGLKGEKLTFEEFLEETNYNPHNAVVAVKIRQKDGSCYPVAIKMYEDGEEIDDFEGM